MARDSMFPEVTLQTAVLFAVAEAGRSLAYQIAGAKVLTMLEALDSPVFLVVSAKESWQHGKQSVYDLLNNNMVLAYVALTTTFGDPRDFSWPAQCYMHDCMMDLQVSVWVAVHRDDCLVSMSIAYMFA